MMGGLRQERVSYVISTSKIKPPPSTSAPSLFPAKEDRQQQAGLTFLSTQNLSPNGPNKHVNTSVESLSVPMGATTA
jgi:hypothetical protein